MLSSFRRMCFCAAACAVAVGICLQARGLRADDVADQLDRQRQVQAETDYTVRRLQTLMRVLDFFQADKTAQQKAMDEMAQTLAGLSQEQMRDVIARLEAAANNGNLNADQDQAVWAKHREILATLKDMINRYDAVQNIDQAAERLEKIARAQFELHLAADQATRARAELAKGGLAGPERIALEARVKSAKAYDGVRLTEQQKDLQKDVLLLMKQALDLEKKLSPDQKTRVKRMTDFANETKLVETLLASIAKLNATGTPDVRARAQQQGIDLQAVLAEWEVQMAHLLRQPNDELAVLKSARGKIVEAVGKQESVVNATMAVAESNEKAAAVAGKCRELGDRQAWVHFETRLAEFMVKPAADDVATLLGEACAEMKDARGLLVKAEATDAVAPETNAKDKLVAALVELDRRIGKLDEQRRNPLLALQTFAERLDRLIAEQTATRATTAALDAKSGKLAETSSRQQDHAKETARLLEMPIPAKDKIEPLLHKAASAMEGAIKELSAAAPASTIAKQTTPHQDRALAALKEARELLNQKIVAAERNERVLRPDADPKPTPEEIAQAQTERAVDEAAVQNRDVNVPQATDFVRTALARTAEARMNVEHQQPSPEPIPVAPKKVDPDKGTPMPPNGPDDTQPIEPRKDDGNPGMTKQKPGDPNAPNGDKGELNMPMAGKSEPSKGDPKDNRLAEAQRNTKDAQAAVAQAQSQAPPTVKKSLDAAAKGLAEAQGQLTNAKPGDADAALAKAEQNLRGALDTLNAVQRAMDQPMPMGSPMAKATPPMPGKGDQPGMQPGQHPGQQPGQTPGQQPGQAKGPSQERNEGEAGKGDRTPDGQTANAKSKLNEVDGVGGFLHLPARQRELINQGMSGNLPPEYANSIQQYYINVARGRPAR